MKQLQEVQVLDYYDSDYRLYFQIETMHDDGSWAYPVWFSKSVHLFSHSIEDVNNLREEVKEACKHHNIVADVSGKWDTWTSHKVKSRG